MAKRKAKTEVTYDVEFRFDDDEWRPWSFDHGTLKGAKESARECACDTRVVRVERTVVAEVKP